MNKLITMLAAILLTGPAISQVNNGPRASLDGSLRSPNSSWSIQGATGAATFGSVNTSGAGAFGAVSGNASAATSAIPDSGALIRSFADRAADGVSARDYCTAAIQNNTAVASANDATACFQNAVNALCARTVAGGRLFIPAGYWLVNGTVTIPCSGVEIAGSGVGDRYNPTGSGTQIVSGLRADTSPMFLASVTKYSGAPTPNGDFATGFYIHDMTMVNPGGNSATGRPGPFIQINSFQRALVKNMYMYGVCNAVTVNGGFHVVIEDVMSEGFTANCSNYLAKGTNATSYTTLDVVVFHRVQATANTDGSCYEIQDRVQTAWFNNTTCETAGYALKSSCPTMSLATLCPGFFTLQDFEAESFGTADNMISLTDTVDGVKIDNSWLRGLGGSSTTAATNLINIGQSRFTQGDFAVTITNSWLKFANDSCILVTQQGPINIIGNHIYGCSKRAAGSSGVDMRSNRAIVTNNQFCGGDWLNDVNWPMQGVFIPAGFDYLLVNDNLFSGATNVGGNACSAGVINNSGGTHVSTANNVGP